MYTSFPAMGTWIEMLITVEKAEPPASSFPAMGTWIEISMYPPSSPALTSSFPAMGTWIEILLQLGYIGGYCCRSLQWERGLKFTRNMNETMLSLSFPAMGTWIEILQLGL